MHELKLILTTLRLNMISAYIILVANNSDFQYEFQNNITNQLAKHYNNLYIPLNIYAKKRNNYVFENIS